METWFWVWLVAAVVLSMAEIFTAGFFMLPFGIGAAVAAALAYFELSLAWQWIAFIGVSTLSFLVLRRFSDRMTHEPPQKVAGDRLIGKNGTVTERHRQPPKRRASAGGTRRMGRRLGDRRGSSSEAPAYEVTGVDRSASGGPGVSRRRQ